MDRPYELGDNEIHLAFAVDDFDAAYKKHKEMGCICFENPSMGIYFIEDPDGYWLEIVPGCSRSKFLTKLLKTFDKTFREIFPVFISTKRREKPSAFFDNNFVNNAYFSEAASSSSSHLASSSSKAPISSRMTCLCLWSS